MKRLTPRFSINRARRRHAAKAKSQFENPQRNRQFTQHLHNPWALLFLWVTQVIIILLIMVLFGYQNQFSDYLNQRGKFADRERAEQKEFICTLISELHNDRGGQLEDLARRLQCKNGPLPPINDQPNSSSLSPIAPGGAFFTSTPTRSSRTHTAPDSGSIAGGNRPTGTKDPARRSTAPGTTPPTTTPPPSTGSPAPGGGGLPSPLPQLCVPLTEICVGL